MQDVKGISRNKNTSEDSSLKNAFQVLSSWSCMQTPSKKYSCYVCFFKKVLAYIMVPNKQEKEL